MKSKQKIGSHFNIMLCTSTSIMYFGGRISISNSKKNKIRENNKLIYLMYLYLYIILKICPEPYSFQSAELAIDEKIPPC